MTELKLWKQTVWALGALAAMLAVILWVGWYATFAAGALLALARSGRPVGWLAFACGALSWGAPLVAAASPARSAAFAEQIGGAFGLSGWLAAAAVLLLPLLLGGLLAASGSWLVRAAEGLLGRSAFGAGQRKAG